jgi:two-component system sensor histidine kinase PilS (NtrC family)
MDELRKRLTYLMLFRVGLVTLLLVATAIAELAAPLAPQSPVLAAMFALIGATYGLTIIYAVLLRRTTRVHLLAAVQLSFDLGATTALVHLTGGNESVFVFMYLLVIVGASTVLSGRGALWSTGAAVVLYASALVARRFGLWTLTGPTLETRELLRAGAVNAVAFAATGALASRLAVQLTQADERIASQRIELRDLATLHQDVIRCLTSGLITLTDDGRVVTFNTAAGEIAGIDPAAATGRSIAEVMPKLAPLLRTSHPREAVRRVQIAHVTADGTERVLGVSLSPLVDAEGQPLGRIVNFQDLTELRRMEEAMTRSERLAAIGRLAAGIAHEIRNPLAAISGSIELLSQTASSGGADNDSRELMTIVVREVERLNGLISDLLEFARPRRPDPQRLDFGATLQEMLRVFENDKHLAGARVDLRAGEPVLVDADAGQLRQLVWNLLRNAAEASPAGAPISVEVAAEPPEWARLTVRDRGSGISAEARARIFEPFFSTKDRGTGLGLATVHRIVEEHHGSIAVDLPTDGGTAMTIRLPLGK